MDIVACKKDYTFFNKKSRSELLCTFWQEFSEILKKEGFELKIDSAGRFVKIFRPFQIYEAKNELVFDCLIFSDGIHLTVGTDSGLFNKAKVFCLISEDATNDKVEIAVGMLIRDLKKDIAEVESKYNVVI